MNSCRAGSAANNWFATEKGSAWLPTMKEQLTKMKKEARMPLYIQVLRIQPLTRNSEQAERAQHTLPMRTQLVTHVAAGRMDGTCTGEGLHHRLTYVHRSRQPADLTQQTTKRILHRWRWLPINTKQASAWGWQAQRPAQNNLKTASGQAAAQHNWSTSRNLGGLTLGWQVSAGPGGKAMQWLAETACREPVVYWPSVVACKLGDHLPLRAGGRVEGAGGWRGALGGVQQALCRYGQLHSIHTEDQVLKATEMGMVQCHQLHLLQRQHAVVGRVDGCLPGAHEDGAFERHADAVRGQGLQEQLEGRDHRHQLVQARGSGLQVLQAIRQFLQTRP